MRRSLLKHYYHLYQISSEIFSTLKFTKQNKVYYVKKISVKNKENVLFYPVPSTVRFKYFSTEISESNN